VLLSSAPMEGCMVAVSCCKGDRDGCTEEVASYTDDLGDRTGLRGVDSTHSKSVEVSHQYGL
jgi:hypothetical protein